MSTLTLDNSNTSTTEVSQAKEITQKPHSFATVDNIIDAAMVAIPKTLMGIKIQATADLVHEGTEEAANASRFIDNKMWNFVGLQIQLPDLQEAAAGSDEIPF